MNAQQIYGTSLTLSTQNPIYFLKSNGSYRAAIGQRSKKVLILLRVSKQGYPRIQWQVYHYGCWYIHQVSSWTAEAWKPNFRRNTTYSFSWVIHQIQQHLPLGLPGLPESSKDHLARYPWTASGISTWTWFGIPKDDTANKWYRRHWRKMLLSDSCHHITCISACFIGRAWLPFQARWRSSCNCRIYFQYNSALRLGFSLYVKERFILSTNRPRTI